MDAMGGRMRKHGMVRTRRRFLAEATGLIGLLASDAIQAADGVFPMGRRPAPPYRVWFQPRLFERDIDLYANMTVEASGWVDPRLLHFTGKTGLNWAFGLNHPDAKGPEYWRDICAPKRRSFPVASPSFLTAGVALDEWVPSTKPENEAWLIEGLRAGRRSNPDVFIAVWSTDPTPPLLTLVREKTVDLVIIEGYTHSVTPGLTISWEGGLRRCEVFANAGMEDKVVFCFGHITSEPDSRNQHWKPRWLRERAEELKRRFPKMPGVAFFQTPAPDTPDLRDLIRYCDRLSSELWPTPKTG